MSKKTLIYGAISLGCCIFIASGITKINPTSNPNNTETNSEFNDINDKISISYNPNEEDVDISIYDYNLDDKEISKQIDSAIKLLPHHNDELFDFIEDLKNKLKHEDKFEYDDTGTYEICTDKRVGEYVINAEVTDKDYLGHPLVSIRIFK